MKNIFSVFGMVILGLALATTGCDKVSSNLFTPEEAVHFMNLTEGDYQILAPGVTYSVIVGATTVSDKDRTVEIEVSSPSGAVQGTDYTLNSNTATIRAGAVTDSIILSGDFDIYDATGKVDTLLFVIKSTTAASIGEYNDTFTLVMRKPCFETEIVLSELVGLYSKSFDVTYSYGPYSTAIVATQSLTSTTGLITVRNLFDAGFNDLVFKLDWTDPFNRTVTLEQQATGADGSVFGSQYAGKPLSILANPNAAGTFSYCNGTFTLRYYLCMLADDLCAGPIVSTMAR